MTDERRDEPWESRLRELDDELESLGAGLGPPDAAGDGPADRPELPTAASDAAPPPPRPADADGADRDGRDVIDAAAAQLNDAEASTDPDASGDPDDAEANAAAKRRRAVLDWIYVVGIALLVAFLIRTFVLAHFVVDGHSMVSTLHDGDRVFVNKLSYRLHDPNRGDVVVLHELGGTDQRDLIKRVIGLPGETIAIHHCQVTIDGGQLIEPYLDPEAMDPATCNGEMAPLTVPDGHVFVLGDNRGNSTDSRVLGPIDEDELVGRAFVVFWPFDDLGWL